MSPNLFIIAVEVLPSNLNGLLEDPDYKGYGLPKWSPKINHLPYATDTILFYSGKPSLVKKIVKVLRGYEMVSGQMINLDKIFLCLHEKVPTGVSNQIKRITGVKQESFPFICLGCLVFYGRKNRGHFES